MRISIQPFLLSTLLLTGIHAQGKALPTPSEEKKTAIQQKEILEKQSVSFFSFEPFETTIKEFKTVFKPQNEIQTLLMNNLASKELSFVARLNALVELMHDKTIAFNIMQPYTAQLTNTFLKIIKEDDCSHLALWTCQRYFNYMATHDAQSQLPHTITILEYTFKHIGKRLGEIQTGNLSLKAPNSYKFIFQSGGICLDTFRQLWNAMPLDMAGSTWVIEEKISASFAEQMVNTKIANECVDKEAKKLINLFNDLNKILYSRSLARIANLA